ncbi:MAG TPA: class I SAM-dependent methyltransferase [Thermoanaerobaculia bacterium]|nr:class I SAM-dependent methyltransferase [Thermoanaerobaculia bacterium]
MQLLPPAALLKTGEVDHADWNYRPLLGAISRRRFKLAVSLLEGRRAGRLLEIGYGSGVFLPELARHCGQLYGIDVHGMQGPVAESLARFGVAAQLSSGSVTAMPFEEGYFDVLVAVSALEFVADLDAACAEIRRVLSPGGTLIVVTPGHSPLVDFGLGVLTGKRAKEDFGDRRQSVIPTLLERFTVQRRLTVPARGISLIHLYTALELHASIL